MGKASLSIPHDQPRASSHINDNYCVTKLHARLLAGSTLRETLTVQSLKTHVNLNVVNHVPSATGHPQRKGISPGLSVVMSKDCTLKLVKGASSVIQLPCVQPVTNVPLAVQNLPVGSRLQNFWQTWLKMGAGPKIVQILKEGYTLPFWIRSNLTRSPTVISRSPQEQLPAGGITSAYRQECNRTGPQSNISRVFQPAFSGTQTQQQVQAYTGPKQTKSFPQGGEIQNGDTRNHQDILQGEWVTSVDFKDAYFHIPIQEQSRKYLRFHVQGRTYQFKALPFGLSTAPIEFTVLAKEVKLMAIHKGIRIHQYLDWLVRARSH